MDQQRNTEDASREDCPLLQQRDPGSPCSPQRETGSSNPSADKPEEALTRDAVVRVALFVCLAVFVDAGSTLYHVPFSQIFEDIVCRNTRQGSNDIGIRGPSCGDDKVVQGELALLRGWLSTISLLPGLFMAIPFGLVADKCGHKLVIWLSVLGMVLSQASRLVICWWSTTFPLRLIWATPLFQLIGGGPSVLSALIFASVSDTTPEAYRSNMFSYIAGSSVVTKLVTSSVASTLMRSNVWVPVWAGLACSVLGVVFSVFIPAALHVDRTERPINEPNGHGVEESMNESASNSKDSFHSLLRNCLAKTRAIIAFARERGNTMIVYLMLTLLTTTLGWHAQDIFVQFARTKYGWSWSAAGYMITLESLVTIFVLSVGLPAASYLMSNQLKMRTQSKDLALARMSCVLMMLGSLVTGLSNSSGMMVAGHIVEFLGNAYNLVLRSLVASLVDDVHTGVLFNSVALLETIGSLTAGPLLAVLFKVGLNAGGAWLGLPFVAAAGLFSIAVFILHMVRL